jgi:hypothetical protein
MEHRMKSLSSLLISGLISSSFTTSVPCFDKETSSNEASSQETSSGESLLFDSLNVAGYLLSDEKGASELAEGLNAADGKGIAVEVHEFPATFAFVEDGEKNAADLDSDAEDTGGAKPKSRVSGKIVIIDAEGKRKEYQFNGDQARMLHPVQNPTTNDAETADGSQAEDDANSGTLLQSTNEERYVLGVQCEECGELLRSHLKLGNKGLVILEVREETPAAEAGLKRDDIILSINGKDLDSLSQLVATVSESDGSSVKLIVLRAGDQQEISVTPRKMLVPTMVVPARMDAEDFDELLGKADSDVRVRRIHPGLLIEGGVPGEQKDVQALIEKLRQMAEKSALTENAASQVIIATPGHSEEATAESAAALETQAAVKQLQEQVRQLQGQLSELQKRLPASKPESDNR